MSESVNQKIDPELYKPRKSMSRVITFSRVFPSYHPRKGDPTYFVEKIWEGLNLLQHTADEWRRYNVKELEDKIPGCVESYASGVWVPKYHTIRAGHRWKVGDYFSPRVWSGKPYNSIQIQFAPDIQVKKVWTIQRDDYGIFSIDGIDRFEFSKISENDGLSADELWHWIKWPFDGQIICWNDSLTY